MERQVCEPKKDKETHIVRLEGGKNVNCVAFGRDADGGDGEGEKPVQGQQNFRGVGGERKKGMGRGQRRTRVRDPSITTRGNLVY